MTSRTSEQPEENYYSILECTEKATAEELRQKYLQLIKRYHPDKGEQNSDKFLLIDEAYKVLKDKDKRKDYDASSLENECSEQTLIYAEINKNQVALDEDGLAYYPCRCGEQFVITREYLIEPSDCLVECSECSNTILLQ